MKELARRAAEALQTRMLAIAAVATLFVSVWLSSFSLSLSLDDSISIEDFLAWKDGAGAVAQGRWTDLQMLDLARIALIADLALFIPAYSLFFWSAARALGRQLRCDGAAIDIASLLYPGTEGLLARWSRLLSLDRLLMLFTLALVVADIVENAAGLHVLYTGAHEYTPFMAHANQIKQALIPAVLGILAVLLLMWFFNLAHPHRTSRARIADCAVAVSDRVSERAVLRRDLADVVWRSRYSLAAIAFFALSRC